MRRNLEKPLLKSRGDGRKMTWRSAIRDRFLTVHREASKHPANEIFRKCHVTITKRSHQETFAALRQHLEELPAMSPHGCDTFRRVLGFQKVTFQRIPANKQVAP
jgi:hypothetical protein